VDLDAGRYRSVPRGGEKQNPTAGVVGCTVNREVPATGGNVIGMGGQSIGPIRHWVVNLVADLDLDLYGTYDKAKHTVDFDGTLNPYSAVALSVGQLSLGFVVPVAVAFFGLAIG
jgi:hypothetical protein